jgi:NAD(P)-dependent dehydrogenase (short-subunit alcohol dehydrogenase family)
MADLAGQVAIVTGGAWGIGGATARRLAADGARVLIADLDGEAAADNAARIRAAGGSAESIVADVRDPAAIAAMIDAAVAAWGRLTILVNNAYGGGPGVAGSALAVEEAGWEGGMAILAGAIYRAARLAAPHLIAAGGGAIVTIASVHGQFAARERLVYATGKAAALGMTRQQAVDLGPRGIRVNAICPGLILTERTAPAFAADPARHAFFAQQYPIRRVGVPDDIAGAVAFLCSPDAAFITGQALVVDGGQTIQLQEDLGVALGRYAREHPEVEPRM